MARKRSPPKESTIHMVPLTVHGTVVSSLDPKQESAVADTANERGNTVVKVNFQAVATSYEPRAAGNYEGTLISHKLNMASATSGQPTVTLDWSENDSPNKHMFKTYSLQPKALWSLKRDLIRIGASVEDMNSEDADIEEIITSLYGYVSTLKFGDPRPGTSKDGEPRLFDNFLEVVDPQGK